MASGRIVGLAYLGDSEAGSAVGRLHENRELQFLRRLGADGVDVHSVTHEDIRRTFNEISLTQIALAGELVESYRGNKSAAGWNGIPSISR